MTPHPAPNPVVGCPECSAPIVLGADRCRSCGLLLVGPTAVRLWEVDQQLAALRSERTSLLTDLRARSLLAPPAVAPSATSAPGGGSDRPGHGPGVGAQRLVLGTGAALVLVAAIVFAAVAWTVIPVAGQAVLMLAATGAAALTATRLADRGLRGSAETLAAVTVGLVLIDLAAARTLGLAGLGAVDEDWYAALGAAAAATAYAGLVRGGRTVEGPRLYAWASVAAAACVPALAVAAAAPPLLGLAVVALAAAAAFALTGERMKGGWATARPGAVVAAAAYASVAVVVSVIGSFVEPLLGGAGSPERSALAFAAVALAASALLRARTPGAGSPVMRALPALVAGAAGLGLCAHSHDGVLALGVLAAVSAAAGAAVSGAVVDDRRRRLLLRSVLAAHGTAAAALAVFAAQTAGHTPIDRVDVHLLAAGLAVVAGAAAVTAARAAVATGVRDGLTAYAGAALLVSAGLATGPADDLALSTAAVLVTAVAIAVMAAWRHGTPDEPALGATAAAGFVAAAAIASEGDLRTLALAVGTAGLTCLGYALLPGRGRLAAGGIAGCTVGVWLLLADAQVHLIEAYSLPLAALAGLLGAVRLTRDRGASSWATAGPVLVAALAPSALASVGDDTLVRPLAVLAAGAATVGIGLRWRWQAPVVTGAAALVIVAVSQVAPYAVGVPRWLSLGGVGVLLLVLGTRYERTRHAALDVARWTQRLR